MPDGGDDRPTSGSTEFSATTSTTPSFGVSGVGVVDDDGVEPGSPTQMTEKNPRKIARKYQLELCKKALEENIIVYLGTGCGKTHIAVLLIHEMGHLIKKPQKKICVFLAPTVALVQQQARVIEDSIDFKVGVYCGSSKRLKSHEDWEKEIEQYEILVMTPQILLRNLCHCFIKMESIALLIFDECHHAQVQSNHAYAEIMKVFCKTDVGKLPRIFGMTASPVVGKGASDPVNLRKSINSLENLLNAKVYTVEDKEELDTFVASPVVRVYDYGPITISTSSYYVTCCGKLDEMKNQCISTFKRKTDDHQSLLNAKKTLSRIHDNMKFCLGNLGLWGALQASRILLTGDLSERNELIEVEGNFSDDSVCNRYLDQAAKVFASDLEKDGIASDLSCVEILKEPYFSRKLLCLIGILSSIRVQQNRKCIIFVNRIVTARSLSCILQKLKILASWKCDFLVGVHSGLKSMSRKTMNIILERFRSGELNLLIATKVGEEGLDIQTCCLVIRFDLPETVSSFIQSRGRARMPQSEYVFLVDSGNQKELDLIKSFKKDEDRMNMEIANRTSNETFIGSEERTYKVDSSGASISSGYSISLLHQYCAKLPRDEFFDPKPVFFYFDDSGGTVCHINLPSNAPLRQVVSTPQSTLEAAKKDACLTAIETLHKMGALNDYLLAGQDDADADGLGLDSADSDSCEGEGPRGELHEMLIPAALKEPWTNLENPVHFNSYYIEFNPNPKDRIYKKFGLFVKAALPGEAERMELDLHLARGRSVITNFVTSGVAEFDKDEIMLAQNFQEMYLKVILDRLEFVPEFVSLGKNDICKLSSLTFYMLLPVILHDTDNKITVDWKIIRRCLSSPVFRTPEDAMAKEKFPLDGHLLLANGCRSISDVKDSLVYAPHKQGFFFITDILHGKNGYSPHKETASYAQHLYEKHGIQLQYPTQPLLHAKPLFCLRNLLHNRKPGDSESHELEEFFIDLPPELCQLKIIGFSKDIGSSISLLPSIMHRLENLLVAIELKKILSAAFPEGAEITCDRVLEALTTEKCQERFSLERLEVLGDAFLKFAVGRHLFLLHDTLDEGQLTRKRSNVVNNSNLYKLATRSKLQVYIRDQSFDPCQFFALGRPCPTICNKQKEGTIHSQHSSDLADHASSNEVRCSKGHHWLHKKTISDVVEALIGAFIVDSGFKAATAFLRWIGIQVDFEASQVSNVCLASTSYMPLAACMDIDALENLLGHPFFHKGLLLQAFVHPSYNKHGGGCYQRLEFLGDAVLDYLITSYLYSVYPKLKPGQLTDLRSVSVNNKAFANVAVDRSFHKFLICDSSSLTEAIKIYVDSVKTPAPEGSLLEGPKCPKALGDLVESCVGAILLDTGFNLNLVWNIMLSFLDPIMKFSSFQLSPIRELQELCQSYNWDLSISNSKKGRMFSVEAQVKGEEDVCATASATNVNKKDAIRIASQKIFADMKAQGYAPKSKSLEEVLKSSCKEEAKLIGYDETPIVVITPDVIGFEKLMLQQPSGRDFEPKIISLNGASNNSSARIIPISEQPFRALRGQPCTTVENHSCDPDSQATGGSHKETARSRLYEICAANHWKPPSFECCGEEGPGHLKLFTFKVVVEIEEAQDVTLECSGEPRSKKKDAAEHAAEGALWYLKNEGYLLETN